MTSPAGSGNKPTQVAVTLAQKAKRKISLPWFRQTSVTPPHPALSRQHTIDTPGSFHAHMLRLQPSNSQVFSRTRAISIPVISRGIEWEKTSEARHDKDPLRRER
ncbi:hypothetical protein TKK_0008205 [Trichogramma kaykai]